MGELKAVHAFDVYEAYTTTGDDDAAQVYLKSEADKVIAELEENHNKEVAQLLILNREQANAANRLRYSMEQALRQMKYKRCLDNVERCRYKKWRERWLKIAEQLKEHTHEGV